MRIHEMVGFERKVRSKAEANKLRREGNVPCVLYGGENVVHFSTPMILFRDLVYTPEAAFVNLNVEGTEYKCVLKDVQFHPVSEIILHADFLLLKDDKMLRMEIPVKFTGSAPGIVKGGKLIPKLRKVKVLALPQNMPQNIEVSISGLDLGHSVKIRNLQPKDYEILNNPQVTIASVGIPRALKSAQSKGEEEEVAA